MDHNKGHETVGGVEVIAALSCDVHNCTYNDQKNHCTASKIKIGPQSANTPQETLCDTFEAK